MAVRGGASLQLQLQCNLFGIIFLQPLHQNNYNLSALAPLAIKKVSINEFYSISKDLPLFVKIPQKTYPDDSFLHLMAKRETIRFAVLQKSYLSGYLHGISIYEISPKITIPNLIHQENEVYI